jgi:multidrug efflux pump subunit AcrB
MEKLLWELPGVEYIYSTSRDSESLVIVRFKVGGRGAQPREAHGKAALELRPHPMGVTAPLIKPKSIDDVPILALTLHSAATITSRCAAWPRRSMKRSSRCRWWPRRR